MAVDAHQAISEALTSGEDAILRDWMRHLAAEGSLDSGRVREAELNAHCTQVLRLLRDAVRSGLDPSAAAYAPLRDLLADLSRARAAQGFTPRETALMVFSLKQPLFDALARRDESDATLLGKASWQAGLLVDRLGLHTMEVFQHSREQLIVRQQQEIAELSTPVIKLWDRILALPLIGTLDSQRTQVVMENLLETIVQQSAEIAIIDITGVPTVDTLTAQHLLKTVAAARLMGADCIISGIRPQIAQTMVHLGVELSVVSKATLADAFALALARQGRTVTKIRAPQAAAAAPRTGDA
jgi:rsbT co-antagonist protein RsbR